MNTSTKGNSIIKKIVFIVMALTVTSMIFIVPAKADFAKRLSYQGRLTDSNGVPLADGSYDMTFKLYTVATGGAAIWTEDHTSGGGNPVAVSSGLFSVVLGGASSLSSVDFNSTAYWVEVVVGAVTYSPRQQLTASPFAMNVPDGLITATKMADGAALAEIIDDDGTGSGLDCDTLDGYDWSTIPNLNDKWVDEAGDTMAGTLDMGNNGITNINWGSSDDGSGSGLDADLIDGINSDLFFILNQNETVTGTPAFNGGTTGSSPPFSVDSTFVVTSLNADLLDGQHGSYYMPASTDHGGLGGLADDDHTQYFHLSQNETVAGRPAFNGGTTGTNSPFTVDSTFVVTSLNADLLDGYTATDFQLRVTGTCAAANQAIKTIAADGTVTCETLSDVTDHGGLTGLGDDDHTQYFNLSQSETVTGTPAFNGGTTGTSPPFSVDSTFVVTSLNADLLDGYTATDFQLRVTGTCAAANQAIKTIAADGTVTCETLSDITDHGTLGGLTDDDHTQYFNLSQSETVAGRPAFNGGTSGTNSPFTVDSNFVVASLNSDLLDGQHGSYYQTRVSGTCALANQAIKTIAADGTVTCETLSDITDHGGLGGLADNDHTQYVLDAGDTMTGNLNMTANIVPTTNETRDLGAAALRWNALHIKQGGLTDNSVVAADISPNIISSIDGLTNDAGNIDFAVGGNNGVTITPSGTTVTFDANLTTLDGRYVNVSGDTMTGRLGQSSAGFHVATKDNITTRTDSGFYETNSATTAEGWPTTSNSWYHLLTSTHSNDGNYYSMQFAADFFDSSNIFYRSTAGSGATAWNRIWHSGNDGSGSGLDADLLDGYDWTNVPNGTDIWVNETGDTMTGDLVMSGNAVTDVGYVQTQAANDYAKFRVWTGTSYAIGMYTAQTFGRLNDYAMTFTMNNDADRGFLWRDEADAASDGAMSLTTDGRLTVKQFLELVDSNTRLSEGAGNALRMQTNSGYIDIGPQNTSWAHITTDRPSFYFNTTVTTAGNVNPYTDDAHDLGSTTNEWRNLYVDGIAYMDNINMGAGRIENVGDPDTGDDAMDRDYADARYVNGAENDFKCTILAFGGGTTNCPTGKAVVAGMNDSRELVNPSSLTGPSMITGYMFCCPAITTFP